MNRDIFEILDNCPKEIKEEIIIKVFKKHTRIIDQGSEVNYVYILKRGKNKIFVTSESGDNYLQTIAERGHIYGEIEVLNNRPSVCSVEAIDDSEVLMLSKEVYKKLILTDSRFSFYIIDMLSNKLYSKIRKTSKDVFYNLEYKFIELILDLHNETNGFRLSITKELIVEELATSLRSVNRIIRRFSQDNILNYEDGYINILNINKLINLQEILKNKI